MTKKILIPTDFTVKSLHLVIEAIELTSPSPVDVLLVHTMSLPTSITELLFFSREKFIRSMESEDFKASWDVLLNKYRSRIKSFNIELFTGHTTNYLNNFIHGHRVTDVFLPSNYQLELKHKLSQDPVALFKKCPVEVFEIPFNEPEKFGIDDLSAVFFLKAGV